MTATILTSPLSIQAEFLPDDVHWFYTYGGPERSEPYVFELTNDYLYTGGLFLSTTGDDDRKNFTRFNLRTEHWESVPGISRGFNGGIWEIHFADDGYLYIGGNFSQVGGVAASHIARFDPATETWSALEDLSPSLGCVL